MIDPASERRDALRKLAEDDGELLSLFGWRFAEERLQFGAGCGLSDRLFG